MSLQIAAQHLASRGRGPDTQLIHMAPQEVAGLQALAKAHGGSLTTNPDTGLPEAGFLSSILPMVAGAALAATGVGAPMAAMMVGGGMTVATGSLQKGLMAGLGAYGGAGIAGGLMGAGAAGAAGASPLAGMELAALENPAVAGFQAANASAAAPLSGMEMAALENPAVAGFQTANTGLAGVAPPAAPIQADLAVKNAVPTLTKAPTSGFTDNLSQIGRGIQNLGEESGRAAFMDKIGGVKGLAQYGLAGLAPVGMEMMKPKALPEKEKLKAYEYSYAPGRVEDPQAGYTGAYTGERTYFNPVYTRTAAGGGLMDIGPVQAMSDRNQAQTLMANQGQMFAEGGETKAVKPVEQDPYYTMSGQSGDAFKYLMGQMPAPSKAAEPASVAAAPAPVQTAAQPVAARPRGLMGSFLGAMTGSGGSDSSMRPYTFDPATGTFTAMPVVNSNAVDFGAAAALSPYYSGGYGSSDSGSSSSSSSSSSTGGGMSNSGEGGADAGWAQGGISSLAQGGPSHLGDYSDGGRLLRGPGNGTSDDIPASIGDKRPARLADGEFVIPSRIVSELGNGSTEAGARQLYAMMDRVQKARAKTTGKNKVAFDAKARNLLPA